MKTNLLALSIALFACGCSPAVVEPTGPTYAEAVATYQAEVALLDSLEAKVDAIHARHKERLNACRKDSIGLISESEFDSALRVVASMSPEFIAKQGQVTAKSGTGDHYEFVKQILVKYHWLRDSSLNEIAPDIEKQKARVAAAQQARDLATP
jgi:hypothetical protein